MQHILPVYRNAGQGQIGQRQIELHSRCAICEIIIGLQADLSAGQRYRQQRTHEPLDGIGLKCGDGQPPLGCDRGDGKIAAPVELFAVPALRGQREDAAFVAFGAEILEGEGNRCEHCLRMTRLALVGIEDVALIDGQIVNADRRRRLFRMGARDKLHQVDRAVGTDHGPYYRPVQTQFAEPVGRCQKRKGREGDPQMPGADHGRTVAHDRHVVHVQGEGEWVEMNLAQRDLLVQIGPDPSGGLRPDQVRYKKKTCQQIETEKAGDREQPPHPARMVADSGETVQERERSS